MQSTLTTILLLFLSIVLYGQTTITIKGYVIDYDTEEPIPFANVYVYGTNTGVTTDIDGNYSISIAPTEGDTLATNSMGYTDLLKPIDLEQDTQTINFRMRSTTLDIQEVVVMAGENPANEIMRQIVKHKPQNDLLQCTDNFEAERYSKTELDLVNITREMKDRKIFKKMQFIFDNIDTVSDVKPFLPIYLAERFYEVYHVKDLPTKEVLQAQKVSGVKNPTIVEFIESMNKEYNIYDNFLELLGKEFISPFSDQGLNYYEYYIMDSTMLKGKWSYKLKFKPIDKSTNTFYGDFWVSMDDYALLLVNMRMNPEVNINLVNRILIYQEYQRIDDTYWIPNKQKTVVDFALSRKGQQLGVIGRKTSSYQEFDIDKSNATETFKKVDPESVNYRNLERADTFWNSNRHEDLSINESNVYEMVDSIQNVPVFKTAVEIVEIIFSGYAEIGPIRIGPYNNLFTWNDVEGIRLSLGIGTSTKLSKKFQIYGYAGYGFKDKRWKYGGNMQYVFNRYRRSAIGVSFSNDATFEVRSSEARRTQSLFAGWLRRAAIPQKMMYVIEGKAWYKQTWKKGFSNKLAFVHRRINPVGYEFTRQGGLNFDFLKYTNDQTNGVDTVSNVITSEVVFKTRFAYKERIIAGAFKDAQIGLGSDYPIVLLTYTAGIKGILKSEYNYHKLRLGVRHWFYTSPVGYIEYEVEVGKVFSRNPLPYLLLEVHPGNEAYFYNKTSFNSMNNFEFVSDFFVHARIEHHWEGFLLNRIPFIRKWLKWRLVTAVRASWGMLDDKHYQANRLNHYDRSIKKSKHRQAPFTEGPFYGTFDKGPYTEASIGIENIFRFIRVDALFRINYLDNRDAQLFSVRVTLNFTF